MDISDERESNNDDGTPTDEYISSYVWSEGHICAAYFDVTTFEMYITYETVDLKPDFCHLKNLMGRINAQTVLASGPTPFLQEIMKIRGLPNAVDPNQYRLSRLKSMSAATFIVYVNNEKTLVENRFRILQLHLPRMSPTITDQERFNFIENLVPLHQNLVVQSLGNLLNFLDANWRHLFLRNEERPIISNLFVYSLEGSVLIDDGTFNSLQVFSATDHPSAFKKNSRRSNEGSQSLFSLMNTCVSRYGSNQLKAWLYQPIREVDEIHLRLHTIEWLRDERNAISMTSFRSSLKKINNAGELYARLVRTHGKISVWKAFKRTLYHTNNIGEICKTLLRTNAADVAGTHIERLGMFANASNEVLNMLKHLDVIIDLEESLSRARFCVKFGLDDDLDRKKTKLEEAIHGFKNRIKRELRDMPGFEFNIYHVTEMGFLLAFPSAGSDTAPPLNADNFKFLYRSGDIFYFTSNLCSEMTEAYGALCIEIHEREEQICERLIQHVYVHIADVQMAVRFTAELDAFMALATFSQVHNLVKPDIITDRKILQISGGRHILLDLQKKFVSNDTSISVDQQNLINILIAPNASGKSVYLKELAQIVYLAHIGSFVPSEIAKISVVDAIYTRMFNPESMFLAKSAFLTEIQEMSKLISNSSENSLVLVDEMGQGTNENDGKSLLLSCLEHLASRAEKAPIAFITTHYVDIFDYLVNKPWIKMKTFKVKKTNHGLVSTYQLIEGKCTNRYAKDCAVIRRFIRQTTIPGSESDNRSMCDESINDEYYETVLEISSDIRNSRIECFAKMASDYMQELANSQVNIDLMDIFHKCSIKSE